SGGVLEQLKSGKQNSNWCLDAPPKRGGITADTYDVHTRRTQACSSCQFGSSPVFRREDDRHLRTAKCFTQGTNSLAWIATPVSCPRLTTRVEADANWT